MSDLLVDIIDLNEKVDYTVFVTLFCSYLLTLWLVISAWVGTDAWKRYENKNFALLFFVATFFLNFPMLIFYFIVRPENKFEDYEEWEAGGVNVPMVNFVGREGVDMVLQLKINPAKIVPDENDMKIDVSWESNKEDMKLSIAPKPEEKLEVEVGGKKPTKKLPQKTDVRADRQVSNVFSKWRGQVRKSIAKIKEVSADYAEKRKPKVNRKDKTAEKENKKTKQNNK